MLHIVPFLDDAVLHGITDLQHGARGCRFVAAHDIFDYRGGIALFFAAEDGATNYGGVLEFGEVLPCRISIIVVIVVEGRGAYLGRVANLEEAGSAIENWR